MRLFLMGLALIALAACSKPVPPVGKWEGGYEKDGTLVAARVEILATGQVRVSAPNYVGSSGSTAKILELRGRLASDLTNNWGTVKPRDFDFDGDTFRKPGGHAPQMVWDKATNQMTLQLYIGANPAMPVPLRPVDGFHDNPWATG